MIQNLKVTSVRYFETRRGLGYECQTNIPNIVIWNDGNGGGTYIERCIEAKDLNLYELEKEYQYNDELESLIDEYENVKTI